MISALSATSNVFPGTPERILSFIMAGSAMRKFDFNLSLENRAKIWVEHVRPSEFRRRVYEYELGAPFGGIYKISVQIAGCETSDQIEVFALSAQVQTIATRMEEYVLSIPGDMEFEEPIRVSLADELKNYIFNASTDSFWTKPDAQRPKKKISIATRIIRKLDLD